MTRADARVHRVIGFFERLSRADLQRLESIYVPDARFSDPFNDVQGTPAIAAIFGHMFDRLEAPRFVVLEALAEGDRCFLTWDFHFRHARLGDGDHTIHGGSLLRFATDGRIALHRDYWDAAEQVYARLPVVGALMRWLRRRAAA